MHTNPDDRIPSFIFKQIDAKNVLHLVTLMVLLELGNFCFSRFCLFNSRFLAISDFVI